MRSFRRSLDRLRDALDLVVLWVLDRIAGPMPKTLADEIRERQRERLRRLFPRVDLDGTGALRKPNDR